jgi:hypothetical protein
MKLVYRRADWFVIAIAIVIASSGCGGGCSGCGIAPIPGGFPLAKRTSAAGQIRVTPTGLAAITNDPAAVIGGFVGGAMNGVITYPVVSCGGTAICCNGNQTVPNCGPLQIDLVARPGDPARLVLAPQQGANPGRLDVTVRARIKTVHPLQVQISGVGDCTIDLDTTRSGGPDLQIATQITFPLDGTLNTTRIVAANTAITQLDSGDYSIGGVSAGDFLCYVANIVPASTIEGQLVGPIESAINGATCKSCNTLADCGQGASACTGGTCMEGSACMQELGVDGRMAGSLLFGGLSPGTTGALDIYEVAGGYATSNNSGLALGLLGGMLPGGTARDRCGPQGTEPPFLASAPISNVFQNNVDPDGTPFGLGIGLHKSQLAELAYGGYDGGLFCLTIGHNTVAQLTTDTISLVSRSLGHLNEANAPMAIGLRPQNQPTITLGNNTFVLDGTTRKLVDPLLDIKFQGMEIDFFASVSNQYVRVFTVVADVHLPVGLDTGPMGTLVPVLGAIDDAFTNVSVKNADAVTESPDDLAQLFPSLLNLVLPQLSGGLSPISLPKLGGLNLSVTKIGAVDDKDGDMVGDYLGIFANLVPATFARTVHSTLDITSIEEPDDVVARTPRMWKDRKPTTVKLALGAIAPGPSVGTPIDPRELEFSLRIDEGSWTPWSPEPNPVLSPRVFWLPGVHHIEARARVAGQPETADPVAAVLALPIGTALLPEAIKIKERPVQQPLNDPDGFTEFHGQSGAAGCACNTSGNAAGTLPLALVVGMMLMPIRRRRVLRALAREAKRLPVIIWIAAIACLPGCSCGSKPCGDADCMPGSLDGAVGRWTSIAGDDQRVMVATYDQAFGDLVVADATDPANIAYKTVDGVPPGITPTYDPSTWRGGVEDPGPKVGAYTSIALLNHTARVSYQDRDAGQLKYAFEDGDGNWQSYVVDAGHGEQVGVFTSIVIDADHRPAIAYLGVGTDDGMNHRNTELRLARAGSSDPTGTTDWGTTVIASAPGTCGGLCGNGACIAGAAATDPEVCVTPTTDCTPACGMGDVCTAAACHTAIVKSELDDIPTGTGLFVKLLLLTDGRLAAVYYDRTRRALVISVETTKGSSMFAETVLDGNVVGADRGMWSSAVVASDSTVHIAYQDALGDQLMYTTWNGAAGTPELVDDGQRPPDRTHNVGAAAQIYVVNGSPAIAYQDGLVSDVYLATKGSTWTTTPLASGPLLDGFSIAATTDHGGKPVLAWDSMDPARTPTPHGLKVQSP